MKLVSTSLATEDDADRGSFMTTTIPDIRTGAEI